MKKLPRSHPTKIRIFGIDLVAKIAAQRKGCQGVVQPNTLSGENNQSKLPSCIWTAGVL
jgi:hypothetical protein